MKTHSQNTLTPYLTRGVDHVNHAVDLVLDAVHRFLPGISVAASAVAGRRLAPGHRKHCCLFGRDVLSNLRPPVLAPESPGLSVGCSEWWVRGGGGGRRVREHRFRLGWYVMVIAGRILY